MAWVVMDEVTGKRSVKYQDRADALKLCAECNREWRNKHLWLGGHGPYVVVPEDEDDGIEVIEGGEHIELSGSVIHRTYVQSTVARCSTCDGGMCFDCTDAA